MVDKRIIGFKQCVFVVIQLSKKEHKIKTDETNLGFLWNILNPLIYMVILSTYYSNVIIHEIDRFPVYVFIGITTMRYYNSASFDGMYSIESNKQLIIKSQFPLAIFVIQKILLALKDFFFSALALIPIMVFFEVEWTWHVIECIPVILATTLILVGWSEMLSVIYVFFADFAYLYSIFMTLMFFISSVFIPINHLPERFQKPLECNPIYISITLLRNAVMYGTFSNMKLWGMLVAWMIFFLVGGHIVMLRNKNRIFSRI